MKRFLLGLALFSAACSGGNPTAPSTTSTSSVPQATASAADPSSPGLTPIDPTPGSPSANATVPQFTFSGPSNAQNCLTPGTGVMQWLLNVGDAGPQHLRFVALAHQDETPGCGATEKNPRARIEISGVSNYTPHSSGQTIFRFDPQVYTCGRVQLDVSILDAAGREILVLGTVVNYGTQCAPPPPNTSELTCTPPSQSILLGQPAAFAAVGGNGTYSWSSPSATPASGSGTAHNATYSNAGTYLATVTSGSQTATCQVVVTNLVTPDVVCAPPSQTVAINQPVNVNATGGSGSYSWSAPGATTTSGSGSAFSTAYAAAGSNTITVSSGGRTATCQVTVPEPPPSLVCGPSLQTAAINQPANVTASGGTGTYSWSAADGSTTGGAGASFSTSYATSGLKTITVTSGGQTATCAVDVPPPPPTLICGPALQTATTNQLISVTASGGTGSYSWSAPAAAITAGTGAEFTTSYAGDGTNAITVTSGNQTASCQVIVTSGSSCPAFSVFCLAR